MKLDFYEDEWRDFIENCGFTDLELEIVNFVRRGWCYIDLSEELHISLSKCNRNIKSIKKKIIRRIDKLN